MPRLECGCWTGIWNGTTPPAQCARHAARSAVLVLDPTRDVSVESVVQQAREATTHPPQLDLLGHHSMDQGTAEMISRMLIDGAPAPAWVWDCLSPDGCGNRICRLAHLMRQAAAAKPVHP